MMIAATSAAEVTVLVAVVVDVAADEARPGVLMEVLPASRPLARQPPAAMMLRRQATRRSLGAPMTAAPVPKLSTLLCASIMLNMFSTANASGEGHLRCRLFLCPLQQ